MSSAGSQDTKETYKIQLYFYTLAMNSLKMKLRREKSFLIASKGRKCLVVNLTKEVQDLYSGNRLKHSPCSWLGRSILLK